MSRVTIVIYVSSTIAVLVSRNELRVVNRHLFLVLYTTTVAVHFKMGQDSSKSASSSEVSGASLGKFVRFLNGLFRGLPEKKGCHFRKNILGRRWVIYQNPTDLGRYRKVVDTDIPIFQERDFEGLPDGQVFNWFLVSGKLYFVQPRSYLEFGTDDVTTLNRILDMDKDESWQYMASGTLKKHEAKVFYNFHSDAMDQYYIRYKLDISKVSPEIVRLLKAKFKKMVYLAVGTDSDLLTENSNPLSNKMHFFSARLGYDNHLFGTETECEGFERASREEDMERKAFETSQLGGAKRRRKSKSPRRKTIRRRSKSTRRSRSHSRK